MNKNKKDKVKDFFRKEGFYLVLFVCLCVIATVTVVTVKNNNTVENNQTSDEFTLNNDEKEVSEIQKQNAERVEAENENELAQGEEVALEEDVEEAVEEEAAEDIDVSSTNTQVVFSNPIEGQIARGYTYPKP